MKLSISIPLDDKCYLLSGCLVNLTKVLHSLFLYHTLWNEILIALYGLFYLDLHYPTLKYVMRYMG